MQLPLWILILTSIAEVFFLIVLFWFFSRLRRSEELLNQLQSNQESLLAKLDINAQLEQELMNSFAERQAELQALDEQLEIKAEKLQDLLMEADGMIHSPQLLREVIVSGYKAGRSKAELAKSVNLTVDEVSLILNKQGVI